MRAIPTDLVLVLIGAAAIGWWLLTPAKHRRRRRGVAWVGPSVYGLSSCSEGTQLTVESESGVLVSVFEKRPDTGGVPQDILMAIPLDGDPPESIEQLGEDLTRAGFAWTAGEHQARAVSAGRCVQVALFGRREDVGIDAIRALRCVLGSLGLPTQAKYTFQFRGGHRDSRLWGRLNTDAWNNPDSVRKAKALKEMGDER